MQAATSNEMNKDSRGSYFQKNGCPVCNPFAFNDCCFRFFHRVGWETNQELNSYPHQIKQGHIY